MRILLDECVDWRLSRDVIGHDVKTARQAFPIAIFVLRARTNRLADLRPLVPALLAALPTSKPGLAFIED